MYVRRTARSTAGCQCVPSTIKDLASQWNDRQNALFDRQHNPVIAYAVVGDKLQLTIDEPTIK